MLLKIVILCLMSFSLGYTGKIGIFIQEQLAVECGKVGLDYIHNEELNYDYADYQSDDYNDYQADYSNESNHYTDDYDNSHENHSESIEIPEKVNRRIPKILSSPREIIVNEGGTITLPCEIDTLDNLLLLWYHGDHILSMGDKPMIEDPRISLEASGTKLMISLAVQKDAGKYKCRASTQENIAVEHSVTIRVAPEVKAIQTLPVHAGDDAILKCEAKQGYPKPEIHWTRQSKHKFRNGEEKMVGSSIWLYGVSRKDSGLYTCHGDNQWNYVANDTVYLEVLHAPEIEQQETFIHTREGDEVEVTCIVHANPPATVEWYMNGKKLERDNNVIYNRGNHHTINISNLGKYYYGKYMCLARNKLGETSKTTEVSGRATAVIYKSSPNGDDHSEYLLQWWTQSNSPVKQFRVDFKPKAGGEMDWSEEFVLPGNGGSEEQQVHEPGTSKTYSGELILQNLDPGKNYVVKVESKNDYGWSDHRNQFEFTTKPKNQNKKSVAAKVVTEEKPPKPEPSVSGAGSIAALATSLSMLLPLAMLISSTILKSCLVIS